MTPDFLILEEKKQISFEPEAYVRVFVYPLLTIKWIAVLMAVLCTQPRFQIHTCIPFALSLSQVTCYDVGVYHIQVLIFPNT